MSDAKPRAKAKPLVAIGLLVILLVATYFGAYYANREESDHLFVDQVVVQGKTDYIFRVVPNYRIAEDASRVIFYPADWVDSRMRPNRGRERP